MSNALFILNNNGGFFSVLFFLTLTYIHCKKHSKNLYITHQNWPYFYKNGWHDYFITLNDHVAENNYETRCSHIYTPAEWKYPLEDYKNALHEIFQLTPDLKLRIKNICETLGSYYSIFIRRGDKIHEAQFIPVKDILKCISYNDNDTFFIQTDDYSVVEEIRTLLPKNKIISTCPYYKRGSYHSKQIKRILRVNAVSIDEKPKEQIKEETEEMLVGLMVCLNAKLCYTDETSNVGRFLKLFSPENTIIYPDNPEIDFNLKINPAGSFHS